MKEKHGYYWLVIFAAMAIAMMWSLTFCDKAYAGEWFCAKKLKPGTYKLVTKDHYNTDMYFGYLEGMGIDQAEQPYTIGTFQNVVTFEISKEQNSEGIGTFLNNPPAYDENYEPKLFRVKGDSWKKVKFPCTYIEGLSL
jgi:hypothetical protein